MYEISEPHNPLPNAFRRDLGAVTAKTLTPAQRRSVLTSILGEHATWVRETCGRTWDVAFKQLEALPSSERAAVALKLCDINSGLIADSTDTSRVDYMSLLIAALAEDLFREAGGATPSESQLLKLLARGRYGDGT